jgi:hypothetical protein
LAAVIKTDPVAAKEVEDKMYKVRVEGRMIKPDSHKTTDGHSNHE